MPHKLSAVAQARAEGFSVDLYCVLQSCIPSSTRPVAKGENTSAADIMYAEESAIVQNFSSGIRALGGEVINCSYVTFDGGDLTPNGRLSSAPRLLHPDYPYAAWKRTDSANVDRTIAQANKWRQVAAMRALSGRPYDLVWRQRPDYVSTGLRLRELASRLLAPSATESYAVPGVCNNGIHGDIEAVLTVGAADHYDALFSHVPALYAGRERASDMRLPAATGGRLSSRWLGPEVLLDHHMRRHGERYLHLPAVDLYRCSPYCFGTAAPCRKFLASPPTSPSAAR